MDFYLVLLLVLLQVYLLRACLNYQIILEDNQQKALLIHALLHPASRTLFKNRQLEQAPSHQLRE